VKGTSEDWRAASNIAVSLSEYLITVAISIIAGQVALAVGMLAKIVRPIAYLAASLVASILLVVSTIYGGWAIAAVYKSGFDGAWGKSIAAQRFNVQAELLLLGFVGVLVSVGLALMPKKTAQREALKEGEKVRKETRTYLVVAGTVLLAVALLHILRLLLGWPFVLGSWGIPKWLSLVAILVTAGLGIWALSLRKRTR
jgi:hypothetical protein